MKTRWTGWVVELRQSKVRVAREKNGDVGLRNIDGVGEEILLTARDVRRLYTKLSADYKD